MTDAMQNVPDMDLDEAANLLARASWALDKVDVDLAQEIIRYLLQHNHAPVDGQRGTICQHCGGMLDHDYNGHLHGPGQCVDAECVDD